MNRNSGIETSVLIKNILIDQIEADNYQEFNKKKCRKGIKPFCDVTNKRIKQDKVFIKLEPLKKNVENQAIPINYHYNDGSNNQQNNYIQTQIIEHLEGENKRQLSIPQIDDIIHINQDDYIRNNDYGHDINDIYLDYNRNRVINTTNVIYDITQLINDHNIKQLSNDNNIKQLSNNNDIKQLINHNDRRQIIDYQIPQSAEIKNLNFKNLCLQFDKQDSSSIQQSSSQTQQSKLQNYKQNSQNKQTKNHVQMVLKTFKDKNVIKKQNDPKEQIDFPVIIDRKIGQQNKQTKKKIIFLTNFCDQDSDQSEDDQFKSNRHTPKIQQIHKQSQVRRKNKIFLKVFGDEDLTDQQNYQTAKKDILLNNGQSLDSDQSNVQVLKPINISEFARFNPGTFYQTPITDGYIFQTIVRRYEQNPQQIAYQMFDSITYKKVLFVKRSQKGFQIYFSNEIRSNSKNIDQQSQNQCAILTSNFFGTQFNCFKCKQSPKDQSQLKKHNRLMTIQYESNIFGFNGPRKMKVYIPNYEYIIKGSKNLHEVYEMEKQKSNVKPNRVQKFINKTPRWNNQISAFVLNFNGRASVSSVKNFIITTQKDTQIPNQFSKAEESSPNYILFGKIQKHVFNLDIKFPFTIVQSMALALSSFDKKFGCQ